MTGRVFTKLLFSFLLLLSLGTAILDFSVRRIVQHSLGAQAGTYFDRQARGMAAQLARTPPEMLPAVVQAQALAARARVTLVGPGGQLLAQAQGTGGGKTLVVTMQAGANTARFDFSLDAVQSTLVLLRRDLLLASLLALGLATAMAVFIADRVARRLRRIVRFANRVAAGELSARVEEGRLDEISEVAHALDATAVQLERSFRALEGSRRELAVLLDSMQEAVVGISPQSQITWSNSKMKSIAPSAMREGRSLVECIRDPDVLRAVEVAMKEGSLGRCRATGFVPGRVFAVSAAPMPGGGAVAVLHDVTEIERAERMRRDFVANVSHELRTPLTSIIGYVETVSDAEPQLSEQGREFLGIVLRNATRMNRLTVDLLALANVEAGDYRIHPRPVPADLLIEDAIESLAGMAFDSGMKLEQLPGPSTPVLADIDALNQVFGNLLENAMKYAPAGKRVRVGARDRGESVEFFVQDSGPGIASEHLGRIFERFYRVDKARSRDSGGTGLGLAIAKHIVLAHGGVIRAESVLGAGATFVFSLPLAPVPEAQDKTSDARMEV